MSNKHNFYPKWIILFLLFVNFSYSTCIVGIFYNDTLYVGVDSRYTVVTFSTGDTTYSAGVTTYYTDNKIHKVGTIYFLTAGPHDTNNFFPDSIIKKNISDESNFIESIDPIIDNIYMEYDALINNLFNTERKKFNYLFRNKKLIFNFILVGIHNNRPRVYLYEIDVFPIGEDSYEIEWKSVYHPAIETDNYGKFIIMNELAQKQFEIDNPSFNFSNSPIESVKKLLSYGNKYDCFCGPPIKILMVTKEGFSYIE